MPKLVPFYQPEAERGPRMGQFEGETGELLPSCPELKTSTTKSFRSEPEWDFWRKSVYTALRAVERYNQAERFLNCGKDCKLYCGDCGTAKKGARYCMSRACPECEARKAEVIQRRIFRQLKSLEHRKSWSVKLLTLSVGTEGVSNEEKLAILKKALPKLNKNLLWRNDEGQLLKHAKKFGGSLECATGLFGMIELGPQNGNPHAHAIYYGPYIPQAQLRKEWERLVGRGNVWINAARGLKAAIREGVKYMSDIRKLPGDRVVEFLELLQGTRRTHSYGIFYGLDADGSAFGDPPPTCPCCGGTTWITEDGLVWMERRATPFDPVFEPEDGQEGDDGEPDTVLAEREGLSRLPI